MTDGQKLLMIASIISFGVVVANLPELVRESTASRVETVAYSSHQVTAEPETEQDKAERIVAVKKADAEYAAYQALRAKEDMKAIHSTVASVADRSLTDVQKEAALEQLRGRSISYRYRVVNVVKNAFGAGNGYSVQSGKLPGLRGSYVVCVSQSALAQTLSKGTDVQCEGTISKVVDWGFWVTIHVKADDLRLASSN